MKKGMKIGLGILAGVIILSAIAGGEDEPKSTTTLPTTVITTTIVTTVPTTIQTTKETTKETTKVTTVPTETTVYLTASQKNAIKMAQQYLNYTAFSREGLIEQLEYEKFSHQDAVFGTDNSGADWNEQAVQSAKDYLDYSAFSKEGLIEQLEYEGFTKEQAKYGVENCGVDW